MNILSRRVYECLKEGGYLEEYLPGFESREGQLQMAQGVAECLYTQNIFLVEAPTGIGKTLAYLVPVILSGMTVVISTGTKNLQEQIYYRDLPLIMDAMKIDVKTCYMKGRSNYVCLKRLESMRPRLEKLEKKEIKIKLFLDWILKTKTGDCEELEDIPEDWKYWSELSSSSERCYGQKCPDFNRCFITLLRKKALSSQIIVVNHHLFFADMAIKEISHNGVIPSYDAVILDEGHQIEKTATRFFSLEVSNYKIEDLQRDIGKTLKYKNIISLEIEEAQKKLETAIFDFFMIFYPINRNSTSKKVTILLSKVLRAETHFLLFEKLHESIKYLAEILKDRAKSEDFLSIYQRRSEEIASTLEFIVRRNDDGFTYWLEKRGKGTFLRASPIDISEKLGKLMFRQTKHVIISSATLTTNSNFDYFKERVGILKSKRKAQEMICPPIFNYKEQVVLFIPRNLPSPQHTSFFEKSCDLLEELINTTQGRALILSTNRSNMNKMYSYLSPKIKFTSQVQGATSKGAILKRFREDTHSVLFATASFWEGVDIPGDALSCVVIDKLPFASPGEPTEEARIQWFRKQGKEPFMHYQLPKAIISFRQGFGRLIRTKTDRGVFSIFDSRVITKHYGKLFIESLPPCRQVHSIAEVEKFMERN